MSEVDRPIKPDQKYLEEYLQKINKVEIKPFLKKHSHQQLPCNAHKEIPKEKSLQRSQEGRRKSKAELYEEIKQKNREKFGDRTSRPVIVEQKPKRLHPKKMTVDYKPKTIIDTTQYKKKDYIPQQKQTMPPAAAGQQNKDKVQYQKLIDYFNRQLKQLQQQKDEFNKVAEKLRFKQMISTEEGLLYTKAKGQVQREMAQRKMANTQPLQQQAKKDPIKTTNQSRQHPTKPVQNKDRLVKTFSAGDIRSKLDKTCEQLQLLKNQMMHQTLQVQEHRYEIFQVHLLPSFTPQSLYDFISPSSLKYNGNSLYQAAMKAFNSQFGKENKPANADQLQDNKPSTMEKMVGEKRVRKYDGWTEVWTPGKQRLMDNSQGYRVIWLSNGDAIQEFPNQIKAYFSKTKEILKIQFKTNPPVYYHAGLKQLWRYLSDGSRQLIFENGRLEIIPHA